MFYQNLSVEISSFSLLGAFRLFWGDFGVFVVQKCEIACFRGFLAQNAGK